MSEHDPPLPADPVESEPSGSGRRRVAAITLGAVALLGVSPLAAGAVGVGPFADHDQTALDQARPEHETHDHATHEHDSIDVPGMASATGERHDHGNHSSPADGQTHGAAVALVDPAAASHTAVASGAWADGSTWSTGTVPGPGSRVIIPVAITVTVDGVVTDAPKTIGVHGGLRFAHDANTELRVDTIVTHPGSRFEIGTPDQPIRPDVTARVVFADDGAIDRDWDPSLLSRGALLHGTTVVQGATKTHRAVVATSPRAGDDVVELTTTPTGWEVGDEFVVTGANGPTSDELRTITGIDGTRVTLDRPLELDHVPPADDLDLYVANLSRNVQFTSENTEIDRRGHLMVMHTLDAQIRSARFTDMGRTDKSKELEDWEFEEIEPGAVGWNGEARALGGTNVRGRYTVHFHRGGADPRLTPAVVADSVVTGDPGWAFTNHSGHVDFERNVAYANAGAGFFTEAGDEVGRWVDNIAIRTIMPTFRLGDEGAIDPDLQADRQSFGVDGDGFWFQGNRVDVIGNVSAGSTAHGLIWWSEALAEADLGKVSTVRVDTLPDPSLVPDRAEIPVWWAPLGEVRDNVAYGSTIGFRSRYVHGASYLEDPEVPPAAYIETLNPVFDGMTTWDVRDGVLMNYNERVTIRNIRAIGTAFPFEHNYGATAAIGVGIDVGNDATFGPGVIEDVDVSGFEVGIIGPRHGEWTIDDAHIAATTDLLLHDPQHTERSLDITDLTFGDLSGTPLANATADRRHVVLAYDWAGDGDGVDPSTADEPAGSPYRVDRVTLDGRGLYSTAAADQLSGGGETDPRVVNGVLADAAAVPTITHVPGRGAIGGDDGEEFDDEFEDGEERDEFEDGDERDEDDEFEDGDERGEDDEFEDGDAGDEREEFDEDASPAFERVESVIIVLEDGDEGDVDPDLAERVRVILEDAASRHGTDVADVIDEAIDALDELLGEIEDAAGDLDVGDCTDAGDHVLAERLRCAILDTP